MKKTTSKVKRNTRMHCIGIKLISNILGPHYDYDEKQSKKKPWYIAFKCKLSVIYIVYLVHVGGDLVHVSTLLDVRGLGLQFAQLQHHLLPLLVQHRLPLFPHLLNNLHTQKKQVLPVTLRVAQNVPTTVLKKYFFSN